MLIQAKNDFSTQPYQVLGPEITAKGPHNRAKLYPAFGDTAQQGHGGFATQEDGIKIWGPDVLEFISAAMKDR